ncbi:N-carbamoyl-L-amino acid hydrolase [bioreactor metagenome]|uniref:N-carbamoyl-L-amino acid hydrolase n=1 Tax=bioreactor metagenome TaxID=1076179 RepID=A0A645I8T3_9ZZZZ
MHPAVQREIEAACLQAGARYERLPSGAFHDALLMARAFPTGMIFVPSVGGISHSPREFSRPEDIRRGLELLLDTVLRLDRLPL